MYSDDENAAMHGESLNLFRELWWTKKNSKKNIESIQTPRFAKNQSKENFFGLLFVETKRFSSS